MPLARLPEAHQISAYLQHLFKAKRSGHGVHSPFAYSLCEEIFYNPKQFYEFENLEAQRRELLKNKTVLDVQDLGAGSKRMPESRRKVSSIAKNGISSTTQSMILFRLINFFNCKTCIELGTSIGLNTLYMAIANRNGKVYSIEGSKSLCDFASEQARKYKTDNIAFIQGNFDQCLPELLKTLSGFDLAYVDGNHSQEATLRYFHQLLENANEQSIMVFDDINWSKEMSQAWEEIKQHPRVKLSISTYFTGYLFFREEIKEKQDLLFWI